MKYKYLIFSDTHFGHEFNHVLANRLKNLIKQSEKVIINGDFYEKYLISPLEFAKSGWNDLFNLLKKKDCIYIYGNHDDNCPKEVWSKFALDYKKSTNIIMGKQNFFITHGHSWLETHNYSKFSQNWHKVSEIFGLTRINQFFAKVGLKFVRLLGYATLDFKKLDHKINSWFMENKNLFCNIEHYLIVGHTHLAYFCKEKKFINTGKCINGYLEYCTISFKGEISLHKEKL